MLGAILLPIQVWRYLDPSALVLVLHPLGPILFLMLLSWALADAVFRSERIKMDQVLGGVVLYLNIGLTFAITYTPARATRAGSVPVCRSRCRSDRCIRPISSISASSR